MEFCNNLYDKIINDYTESIKKSGRVIYKMDKPYNNKNIEYIKNIHGVVNYYEIEKLKEINNDFQKKLIEYQEICCKKKIKS